MNNIIFAIIMLRNSLFRREVLRNMILFNVGIFGLFFEVGVFFKNGVGIIIVFMLFFLVFFFCKLLFNKHFFQLHHFVLFLLKIIQKQIRIFLFLFRSFLLLIYLILELNLLLKAVCVIFLFGLIFTNTFLSVFLAE